MNWDEYSQSDQSINKLLNIFSNYTMCKRQKDLSP